jgi:hypothetical protein
VTDAQMLDWLEGYVNTHGALLLHDGSAKNFGYAGLGLRPGSLRRTLREAITQSAAPEYARAGKEKEK